MNGSLKNILPDNQEVIKTLKDIGILNAKGNKIFYNCVVFPLYDRDGISTGLYERNRTLSVFSGTEEFTGGLATPFFQRCNGAASPPGLAVSGWATYLNQFASIPRTPG